MKRKKKYNPLKQLNMVAKHALKNIAVGFVTGGRGCLLVDLRNSRVSSASETTIRLISTLRHRWSVLIAVLGVDSHGKQYMKSEEVTVTEPCLQSELSNVLNIEHIALGKNFNKQHLVNYGWLATPYVKEWDEQEAFKILSALGAYTGREELK